MIAPVITLNPFTTIIRQRELKPPAEIRVRIGQRVDYDDVIAEETTSYEYLAINIADGLNIDKLRAIKKIVVHQGELLHQGDLIAGPVGTTKRVVRSPIEGQVLLVHDHQVYLRKQTQKIGVEACIPGEIIDIDDKRSVKIKNTGGLFEGIWGNGGITYGKLRCYHDEDELAENSPEITDRIFYLPTCVKRSIIEYFVQNPPQALVIGSCSPHLIPIIESFKFPVIILIGFDSGEPNLETSQQISQFDDFMVTIDATHLDHHKNIHPALIIPNSETETTDTVSEPGFMHPGSKVRVTLGPQLGNYGTIIEFEKFCVLPNGIQTDCGLIKLDNKELIKVPLDNLEILT